jgi:hypothetical protein
MLIVDGDDRQMFVGRLCGQNTTYRHFLRHDPYFELLYKFAHSAVTPWKDLAAKLTSRYLEPVFLQLRELPSDINDLADIYSESDSETPPSRCHRSVDRMYASPISDA